MQAVTITQITPDELGALIDQAVSRAISKKPSEVVTPEDELLTTDQAAALLGLSLNTIYGKIHRKEVPHHKPPGSKRVYFSRKALTSFINSGRVKTNTELSNEVHYENFGKRVVKK